jgi:hypothetical protein
MASQTWRLLCIGKICPQLGLLVREIDKIMGDVRKADKCICIQLFTLAKVFISYREF